MNYNNYSFLDELIDFPTINSTKGLFDSPKDEDTKNAPEIIYTNDIHLINNKDTPTCVIKPQINSNTCNNQRGIMEIISSSFNNCGTTMAINFSFIFSLLSTILFIILITLLIVNDHFFTLILVNGYYQLCDS